MHSQKDLKHIKNEAIACLAVPNAPSGAGEGGGEQTGIHGVLTTILDKDLRLVEA